MKTHNYHITNCDTDSISFRKMDEKPFTDEEQKNLLEEINKIMPNMIEYEDDGYFESVLIVKAKNYVLRDLDGNITYKGSSIKDQKKEPALREMLNKLILDLIDNEGKNIEDIYHRYIQEAMNIQDINRWAVKKSISEKILNPSRKNEQVILDAVKHKNPREGDKFYLYTAIDGERQKISKGEPVFLKDGTPKMEPNNILKTVDDWNKDDYKEHYVKRVYMTLCILENLIDIDKFIKYHNKGNHKLLYEKFSK
jgi:hypothetical protein